MTWSLNMIHNFFFKQFYKVMKLVQTTIALIPINYTQYQTYTNLILLVLEI